jgi:Flp pilus assembly protein TadD
VARVAIAQQDYAAAEAILRQGLSRSTAPRAINFWLGVSLYHQQQYERAQLEFERAANLQPKDPVVHFWLGSTFEELGRYPQARAAYERALTLDPAYQQAREALDRLTRQGH